MTFAKSGAAVRSVDARHFSEIYAEAQSGDKTGADGRVTLIRKEAGVGSR
jgi:hypothetical protein